jgi:DNA polymerase III subunit beta
MQFQVKRNDLLQELNLAMGVVEKKRTIPILANILMDISKDYLAITATDQELAIRCGCAVQATETGAITIPSSKVFEIVRLLPDADLVFRVHENNWVEIRCGNSNFKIAGLPKDNYPEVPQFSGQRLTLASSTLKEMIQRTVFAITQEESRYTLNGALLVLSRAEIKMVTTDGHRLAYIQKALELDMGEDEIRLLIPKKTLSELLKLMDQQLSVELGRDERNLYFKVGARELVSHTLAGQFPNFEMVLPRDNENILLCNTALMSDSVRRAAIMAEERNRPVKFIVSKNHLEMVAATADQGESREHLDAEYSERDITTVLNAHYTLDFLACVKTEKVSFAFKDEETQVLLRPDHEDDFDYQYVIMPMSV